jgi:hypothetical protein
MAEHCWHKIAHNSDHDAAEICCFCGTTYNPNLRSIPPGYGKFTPLSDQRISAKPSGPCPGQKTSTDHPLDVQGILPNSAMGKISLSRK